MEISRTNKAILTFAALMSAVQGINIDQKNRASADYAHNNAPNPESALIKFRSQI